MSYGGNLGAAGTRVTRRIDANSDLWLYIGQSVAGALAMDSVLTLVLMSYVIIGWWSMVLVLGACGFLIGMIVLIFGRPSGRYVRMALGNLWGIGALIGGLVGRKWYAMISDSVRLIVEQIELVFGLPWWAYAALGAALLVIVLYGRWKTAVALLISLSEIGRAHV